MDWEVVVGWVVRGVVAMVVASEAVVAGVMVVVRAVAGRVVSEVEVRALAVAREVAGLNGRAQSAISLIAHCEPQLGLPLFSITC